MRVVVSPVSNTTTAAVVAVIVVDVAAAVVAAAVALSAAADAAAVDVVVVVVPFQQESSLSLMFVLVSARNRATRSVTDRARSQPPPLPFLWATVLHSSPSSFLPPLAGTQGQSKPAGCEPEGDSVAVLLCCVAAVAVRNLLLKYTTYQYINYKSIF